MASKKKSFDRRGFLKNAAAGAAAMAAAAPIAAAQQVRAAVPSAAAAETASLPKPVEVLTNNRPGADFMTDVVKTLGIEFATANPSSSLRGWHESLINYGGNKSPEWIICCSVGIPFMRP